VENDDEYSTSRIALKNGPYYDYESIEAGWVVCITQILTSQPHSCLVYDGSILKPKSSCD